MTIDKPKTFNQKIKRAMNRLKEDLNVCLPGRILSYDQDSRLATIQPVIKRRFFAKDQAQDLPEIRNVPVVQQRTQTAMVYVPPKEGDLVLLVFADRSIENWLQGNGESREPLDVRKHSIDDAFALLGGFTPSGGADVSVPNNVILKNEVCEIHIEPSGLIHLGSSAAADFVALAQKVLDQLNQINADINTLKVATSTGLGTIPLGVGPVTQAAFDTATANIPQPHPPVSADKVKAD